MSEKRWSDPDDPQYDPEARAECPKCGMSVGYRHGRYNRHSLRPPGVRNADWCPMSEQRIAPAP